MLEYIIVLGALAFIYYKWGRKTHVKPLHVKKVSYDAENNTVKLILQNKNPLCYKFKTAIRYKEILTPIVAPGMMAGSATDRQLSTLLAENTFPMTIGPNETVEVSLIPILPKEMISHEAHNNLSVELRFVKYENILKSNVEWSQSQPPIIAAPPDIIQTQPTPEEMVIGEIQPIVEIQAKQKEIVIEDMKAPIESPTITPIKTIAVSKSPFVTANMKHRGRMIGHSQSMLQIMRMMDKLKEDIKPRPPVDLAPFPDAI